MCNISASCVFMYLQIRWREESLAEGSGCGRLDVCVQEYTPDVDTSVTVAADGGMLAEVAGVSVCCVYTECCLITSVACALSFRPLRNRRKQENLELFISCCTGDTVST